MLKMLSLLFLFIKLSYSYFNFTFEFISSSSDGIGLKFKSNTELDVNAFIYDNSNPASSITIERSNSYEYYIDCTDHLSSILNVNINTNLISLNEMFMNADKIRTIKMKSSDEKVQYMERTFELCTKLTSVDLTEFDLSNVISFRRTFYKCDLHYIDFGNSTISNVENMEQMFYEAGDSNHKNLELNLSMFDTSKVTKMNELFSESYCSSINLKNFNTSLITNFSHMFSHCWYLKNLDLSSFDTSNGVDMSCMFCYSNFISLNISNFNTSSVLSMDSMFSGCDRITSLDLSNFNTSRVKSMNYMLSLSTMGGIALSEITTLDLRNFNTSSVTSMRGLFYGCLRLVKLNIKNFDTSLVTDMREMFQYCLTLSYLDISGFNTEKVTNTSYMFRDCNLLTSLDLENFKMTQIKDMRYMFNECNVLKSLNLINIDTSLTTNMYVMFYNCKSLSFLNINNFNTSKVTDMYGMFEGCVSLVSLNLSKFVISPNTRYEYIMTPISGNLIYCMKDEIYDIIKSEIDEKGCTVRDNNCINGWSKKSYKYIEGTDKCVEDCNSTQNYKYEYRGSCYSTCPSGTTSLYNNDFQCEDFSEVKFLINEEIKKNITKNNNNPVT